MTALFESISQLLGSAPNRPARADLSPEVIEVYDLNKQHHLTRTEYLAIKESEEKHGRRKKWRRRRWITLIIINLLFVVSFFFDVQLVEGALTGSRVVGFHFADLNSALQVMLAYKHVVLNLLIGTLTVFIFWWLLGGRTFCSWCCPYHLLSEFAEKIHLKLVSAKIIKNRTYHRGVRTLFYVNFTLLAFGTSYTVFESISPTGIISRALIYGPGLGLIWVLALLLFEIFVSRRAWCRYVCPIGMTYAFVGITSPLRVVYNASTCHHEGECSKVCLVPHVLDVTLKGRARRVRMSIGADCTRCAMCLDVCPTGSLSFEFKGLSNLLNPQNQQAGKPDEK